MALQQPDLMWFNGEVVPWGDGKVHVWTEVAIRGASVFEGLRAYWRPETETYGVVSVDRHFRRMAESAKILRFPEWTAADELRTGMFDLLAALDYREHTYLRPTVYIEKGRYAGVGSSAGLGAYVVAFPVPRDEDQGGQRCCVSSWRRADDLTTPPRAKTGAAYASLRYPILEAQAAGVDEAIILNDRGKVAEATAASVFVVRGSQVATPPVTAGILESITRLHVLEQLRERGDLEVVEREIDRTELYVADEVFTCGTLQEVQPVVEVDGVAVGNGEPGPVAVWARDRYLAACLGDLEVDWVQEWSPATVA